LQRTGNLYKRLMAKGLLEKSDGFELAKKLQQCLQSSENGSSKDYIVDLAIELSSDLRNRRLLPTNMTGIHLLYIFEKVEQFDEGFQLWDWWSRQHDGIVDRQAFGAALSFSNKAGASLSAIENLYSQALERFSGEYAAYHMSPNAVISDRTQMRKVWGTSMRLLQRMCGIRVQRGDLKNAYLDLDTALRLFTCTVNSDFFTTLIELRPVAEGYIIVQLACRNSTPPIYRSFRRMLGKLTKEGSTQDLESKLQYMHLELDAIHAFVGVSSASKLIMHDLCNTTFRLLAFAHAVQAGSGNISAIIYLLNLIFATAARKSFEVVVDQNFNSLVSAAGSLKSRELLDFALQVSRLSETSKDPITYCTIIKTAGSLQDVNMMKRAWQKLVDLKQLTSRNWKTFARAGMVAGVPDLVREEVKRRSDAQDYVDRDIVEAELAKEHPEITSAVDKIFPQQIESLDASVILEAVGQLGNKIKKICNMIQSGQLHNFAVEPIRMSMQPLRINASEADIRQVYDRLTMDPRERARNAAKVEEVVDLSSAPALGNPGPNVVPITSSGFRMDDLRYENWKTINELLVKAARQTATDLGETGVSLKFGKRLSVNELQDLILRLRGMSVDQLSTQNVVVP